MARGQRHQDPAEIHLRLCLDPHLFQPPPPAQSPRHFQTRPSRRPGRGASTCSLRVLDCRFFGSSLMSLTMPSHGPDGSIPDWAARPLTCQATSGSWVIGEVGHEHRRVSEPSPWSRSVYVHSAGHSWLPTHRRPVARAHFPCLSRPPERMWTDAVGPVAATKEEPSP